MSSYCKLSHGYLASALVSHWLISYVNTNAGVNFIGTLSVIVGPADAYGRLGHWSNYTVHSHAACIGMDTQRDCREISLWDRRLQNDKGFNGLLGHQCDGLVQDCSISIANALEILQTCNKPPIEKLSRYDDKFVVTGGTMDCGYDTLRMVPPVKTKSA